MVKRLVVYGLLVIAIICTAEAQRTQREGKEITISLGKVSYTPYQDEYEKLLYPTVRITTPSGTGSGVIFHRRDAKDAENTIYILSASHVVGNESKVSVEIFCPKTIEIEAEVLVTDTIKDLSLLRALCDSAVQTYSAKLAPENYTYYLFNPVYAVGCSLGLPPRPSSGILSALGVSAVEITAPVLPGNSGGPVFDARTYEVIGIAVWVKVYQYQLVTTMAGIVPIQEIYKFLLTAETQRTLSKTK